MSQEVHIEIAFNKWWADFNADSDDLPGDKALAFASFRAGYLRHANETALIEDYPATEVVSIASHHRPKTHKEAALFIAPQLVDAFFQFETKLNSLPQPDGWALEDIETALDGVGEPIEWMEDLVLVGATEVPVSQRRLTAEVLRTNLTAEVLRSKAFGQLAKVLDKSATRLKSLREAPVEQDRAAEISRVLKDVRYAANDIRRALET